MNLYAGAFIAFKGSKYSMRAGFALADSDEEAMRKMLNACYQMYPLEKGWHTHQATVVQIDDGSVAAAYSPK